MDDNLRSADAILSASESTLSQAQTILNDIRGLAVQAVGTTLSEDERGAFRAQVQTAIQKLTELGNAKFRDQYIFGGNKVGKSPFVYAGDAVRFQGNGSELPTITDYASTIAANVSADDAFGAQSREIVGSVDLNPGLAADTPLSILNRGEGIRRGAISISDGLGKVEIDLSTAHNMADIIERIESTSIGNRDLQASLTANGLNITFADGLPGILRIDEVGSGNMASDLGINNADSVAQSPVLGKDLNPLLTRTTRIAQLFNNTGFTIGDSLQIRQAGKTFKVSTSGIQTVEDFTNRIARSGAKLTASIAPDGRGLLLQSTESGTAFSVGEEGSNLATQLGLRTFAANTPLNSLNFGQGIFKSDSGPDLIFKRSDGSEMVVSLNGTQTVGDAIARINNQVDNFTPGLRIVASLATTGNGIVLTAPAGAAPISVRNAGGSQAARGLGLLSSDDNEAVGSISGTNSVIQGTDVSGLEVEGVFTTLIRLRQAIETNRPENLLRITDALDADLQRLSLARGFVGARQQSIESMADLSAEQQVQLKKIESDEIDADLATVISELTAREAALQASLQLMSSTTRQSLFDYI